MAEKALKAVELLARPPLTDIPERLRILANELDEDVTALIVVDYPSGRLYNFGQSLSRFEVKGLLIEALTDFTSGHHEGTSGL